MPLPRTELTGSLKLQPLPSQLTIPVLLRLEDDVAAAEIVPPVTSLHVHSVSDPVAAGIRPFEGIDQSYVKRTRTMANDMGHCIVAGHRFGRGPCGDLAALAPRLLGLRVVLAKSYAKVFRRELIEAGIVPLLLELDEDWEAFALADQIEFKGILDAMRSGNAIHVQNQSAGRSVQVNADLDHHELEILARGGRFGDESRRGPERPHREQRVS